MRKSWILFVLAGMSLLRAQEKQTEIQTEPEGEIWRMQQEAYSFDGVATDDFFALTFQELSLDGDFQDDVWGAGLKVHFKGTAENDVRLLGLEVLSIDGRIGGNLRASAPVGNLLLNTNSVIGGRAVLNAGKRATIKGRIDGDLWVEAPNVVIEAEIFGNLTLKADEIQLLPGTVIHGDLRNRNRQTLPLPPGVEVQGERKQIADDPTQLENNIQTWKWMIKGLQFLTSFLIGLMMLRILPRFTGQNVDMLLHYQHAALSKGLFAFLIFGISGYLLMASVLGTGLGIFLLTVTALCFYLGKIFVAYAIGLIILRQKTDLTFGKLSLGLFIGLVVLYSAYSLVYIGEVLYFMTSCWGMGTMLTSIRNSQRVLKIDLPQPPQPPIGS